MKKLFLLFGYCYLVNFNVLEASTLKSCCARFSGFPQDVWTWNRECRGCYYLDCGKCESFEEPSNFLCDLRAGACRNNGINGLVGTTNTSFFNLREKPTRQYPSSVQTRGTAISITENDFLNLIQPNKVQTTQKFAPSESITFDVVGTDDGSGGKIWTIPSTLTSLTNGKELLYFVDPSSLPAAAQVTGATHVGKKEIVDEENNILTEYTHFKFAAGQDLEEMGSSFINQNNGTIVNHGESTAQIYADSPLDLGDDFTTDITEYEDDDEVLPFRITSTHVTVDDYGTINNPYTGTIYNCLRMTLEETVEEYSTDENTPDNTTTYRYYMWVTKEGFRFIVKDPGASPTVTDISMVTFSAATTLDVELLDFQGIAKEKSVELTWTTANENNNEGFEIERSNDGKTFEKIGFVKGNGTTHDKKTYSFTDITPLSKTAYYRLQQVDFDGSKVSSNVISIEPKSSKGTLKVYPNPSTEGIISIVCGQNTEGMIIISNSLGQVVWQQNTNADTPLSIDLTNWSKGLYFVKSGNELVKFVKQ